MKQCNSALAALLDSGRFIDNTVVDDEFVPFDLYTFTLTSGDVLTYTTANFPITAASSDVFSAPRVYGTGDLWSAGITWMPFLIDPGGSRSTGRWRVGLDTDTWTIHAVPRQKNPVTGVYDPDMIGSVAWLTAVRSGMLDNADVLVSRAYFAEMPSYPLPAGGVSPVGTLHIFRGVVGDTELTDISAVITVADYKSVLDQMTPRNVYQSGCPHQLFDSQCGLTASAFAKTGTTASGTTRAVVKGTVASPTGSGTWALGRLLVTSGQNAGISRLITAWSSPTGFTLLSPFPYSLGAGEQFTVYPGCNKTIDTCTLFANKVNFGGTPYIPVPEVTL